MGILIHSEPTESKSPASNSTLLIATSSSGNNTNRTMNSGTSNSNVNGGSSNSNSTTTTVAGIKAAKSRVQEAVTCAPDQYVHIASEWMVNRSVSEYLRKSPKTTWGQRRQMAIHVAMAMNYLHGFKPPILHRCLTSGNVLLTDDLVAKISDYGLDPLRRVAKSRGLYAERPYWSAPEVLRKNKYSRASDVYSFGMVLYEIITRVTPFATSGYANDVALTKAILSGKRPLLPDSIPKPLKTLLQACWEDDPGKRPDFATIIDRLKTMASSSQNTIVTSTTNTPGSPNLSNANIQHHKGTPHGQHVHGHTQGHAHTHGHGYGHGHNHGPMNKGHGGTAHHGQGQRGTNHGPYKDNPHRPPGNSRNAINNAHHNSHVVQGRVTHPSSSPPPPAPPKNVNPNAVNLSQAELEMIHEEILNHGDKDVPVGAISDDQGLLLMPSVKEQWMVDWDDVHPERIIGTGSFGEVWCGTYRGNKVAIKTTRALKISAYQSFLNELTVLPRLRHPNIVMFIGAVVEPRHMCYLMEFCEKGTLFDALHDSRQSFDYKRVLSILIKIAKAMVYLHSQSPPVLHRDLKSLNILLHDENDVKVCDFGLASYKPANILEDTTNHDHSKNIKSKKPTGNTGSSSSSSSDSENSGMLGVRRKIVGTLSWQAPEVLRQGFVGGTVPTPTAASGNTLSKTNSVPSLSRGGSINTSINSNSSTAKGTNGSANNINPPFKDPYTTAADVYSFGIIAWELVTRKTPFADMNPHLAAYDVALNGLRPEIPSFVPPQFRALIERCWHSDPTKRPSFDKVTEALEAISKLKLPRMDLRKANAKYYTKKAVVYAFRSLDKVIVRKSWGTGESKKGDFVIVGPNCDVYTCDAPIFLKSYARVTGPDAEPNMYKKIQRILALQQQRDFLMETLEGMEHGVAGDYVAENPVDGEQWPIPRETFESMYELAEDQCEAEGENIGHLRKATNVQSNAHHHHQHQLHHGGAHTPFSTKKQIGLGTVQEDL